MKLVVFGLSISSSWGNGHATLWRGLCGALAKRGHRVIFFERDVPYYASTRDLFELPAGQLVLYDDWRNTLTSMRKHLSDCDVAMVTSYCPDAIAASDLVLASRAPVKCFYDLDSPVTLDRLDRGLSVEYIGPRGLRDFDLVLSYAGGIALSRLQEVLGARVVAVKKQSRYVADLSYLGTNSADREAAIRAFLVDPAKSLPEKRFLIAGSMYDENFPWQPNIHFIDHLASAEHSSFYSSARLNLNIPRRPMAENGYCPSGRLFEAAACGAAILTDEWQGLDQFFEPGAELLVARQTDDVIAALDRSPEDLERIGQAARQRTLHQHTADVRVRELEQILSSFPMNQRPLQMAQTCTGEGE